MTDNNITYRENFKIRASEIDFTQKATLPSLCNLLQEIAGNHARKLHFDITDLQENKMTWVLHRLVVKIDRFPDWRETITIKTWPSSGDGLRAYRDFRIIDDEGNIIGTCLSYWLILNIENRRPTRIPKSILDMAPKDVEHVLAVEDACFAEIDSPAHINTFNVRKTDLDLNRHVNNVRYIEWALSCLPEQSKADYIDIKFMSESILGDKIIAEGSPEDEEKKTDYLHQIKRQSDQKILALAQTKLADS